MTHLVKADLVVSDLSGLNANVMYELALRHSIRKPCIMICLEGQQLPFDLYDKRTIFFRNDYQGGVEFRGRFHKAARAALDGTALDNPVVGVLKDIAVGNVTVDDPVRHSLDRIIERLESLESELTKWTSSASWINRQLRPSRPATIMDVSKEISPWLLKLSEPASDNTTTETLLSKIKLQEAFGKSKGGINEQDA